MTHRTAHRTIRFVSGLLLVLSGIILFAPLFASAQSATPSSTNRFCYSYRNGVGTIVNECRPTQAACEASASANANPILSLCDEVMKPDPTAMVAADVDSSRSWLQRVWDVVRDPFTSIVDATLGSILRGITYVIFVVAGWFLQSMGVLMDYSIRVSIDSKLIGGLAFVNVGWTAVRDLANMFFIFALLYIAIQTVLGLVGGGTKRWVAHIIIAAVLINFSLFFTKIVIDAGNVLATSFWDKLRVEQRDPHTGTPFSIPSASAKFLPGFDLQTVFSNEAKLGTGEKLNLSQTQWAMLYAGGAVFMFIAGYIFLAAAIMMVTRTIALLLLMVFSPFAFLSFGIPGMSGIGHEWLGRLIKQTFVAPIYIFMLYLNSILIDSVDLMKLTGSNGETFSAALTGDPRSFGIIYNFILLIGFLLASLMIADRYAGGAGAGARSIARKITGTVAGGTGAVMLWGGSTAMRNAMAGKAQQTLANKELHELAKEDSPRGRRAQMKLLNAERSLTKAYDFRNTWAGQKIGRGLSAATGGAVNIGEGGKKGFAQRGSLLGETTSKLADTRLGAALGVKATGMIGSEERERKLAAAEKSALLKKSPEIKEQYLRTQLGGVPVRDDSGMRTVKIDEKTGKEMIYESAYDTALENKELRERIARDIKVNEQKKALEERVKEEKENVQKLKDAEERGDNQAKAAAEEMGKQIADAIKKAMQSLSAYEKADLLPSYINSKAFVENLAKADVNMIHNRVMANDPKYATITILKPDGSDSDASILDHVGATIMSGENKMTQKYIMSHEGKRNLLNMDIETLEKNYADTLSRLKEEKSSVREAKANLEKARQTGLLDEIQKAQKNMDDELAKDV